MAGHDYRVFEVNGYVWDYEKIAMAGARIGDEFLERCGIGAVERHKILAEFSRDVAEFSDGFSLTEIPHIDSPEYRNALFVMRLSADTGDPYEYDRNGRIVDYLGHVVPEGFEFTNSVSLSFSQRAWRDPLIKDTPIPKMNAEELARFVQGVASRYEGLRVLFGPQDPPVELQKTTQYSIVSSLDFDRGVYGIGPGRINIELYPAP